MFFYWNSQKYLNLSSVDTLFENSWFWLAWCNGSKSKSCTQILSKADRSFVGSNNRQIPRKKMIPASHAWGPWRNRRMSISDVCEARHRKRVLRKYGLVSPRDWNKKRYVHRDSHSDFTSVLCLFGCFVAWCLFVARPWWNHRVCRRQKRCKLVCGYWNQKQRSKT